jgi:Ca2+-transporting ATPase
MSELVSIFFASLFGFVLLHPVHLLCINLIRVSFPALALGMEKGEAILIKRKPRSAKSGIFSEGLGFDVLYQGLLVAALTLTAYFTGNYIETGVWEIAESKDGITMAFLTLSFAEIFHSFNMRSQRTSIFKIRRQNVFLWGAGIASLVLTTLVIYVPFLAKAFEFEHINTKEYIVAVLIAACVIPIVEIVKLIQRTVEKRK